jgi:RHS repeat-associated protein
VDGVIAARFIPSNGRPNSCNTWEYGWGGSFAGAAIDEFAVYDRALTPHEVASSYIASGRQPARSVSEMFGPNGALRNQALAQQCECDPVDVATGNLHMPLPPVAVPGRGPGLAVALGYNSLAASEDSPTGFGWSSLLGMRVEVAPGGSAATVVQETGASVPFTKVGSSWVAPDRFTATLVASGSDLVFTRAHFESFRFDSAGRLVEMSDQFGNSTTLNYTGTSTKANYLEDEAGRRLAITWTGDRVDTISDPLTGPEGGPRVANFDYDANGDLTSFTDLSGGVWTFTYTDHRLMTMRKPRHQPSGPVVENHYDSSGRVDWQEDELDRRTVISYDSGGLDQTLVTLPDDAGGPAARQRLHRFEDGLRVETIEGFGTPDAVSTKISFDPETYAVESITDGANKTTLFEDTNGDGNPDKVTDPTNRITRYTYNVRDQVTSVEVGERTGFSSTIVRTTNEYDATTGRLEKTTVAEGGSNAVTDYQYTDPAHPEDLRQVVDARAKTWKYRYDPNTGYRTEAEDPLGNITKTAYNTIGWPTVVTSPRGVATASPTNDFETRYSYDIAARTVTVTGPTVTGAAGDQSVTVFDANGNTDSVSTAFGVTDYQYTAADELWKVVEPGAATTTYTYWASGERKTWTNELDETWQYAYDGAGRLETETDPLNSATTYDYDAAGRLKWLRQPVAGATCPSVGCTAYTYDDAGRPTSTLYSDATPDVTGIDYDNLGRRTKAFIGGVEETWGWNDLSQLNSHKDANTDTTSYSWDKTGNLTHITYPGQTTPVARVFDDAGRMTSSTDWSGRTITFGPDADSNWTSTTFPGSSGTANTDRYTFDGSGRMMSATWHKGAGTTVPGCTVGDVNCLGAELYTRPTATTGMVDLIDRQGAAGSVDLDLAYDNRSRLTSTGTGTAHPTRESFTLDAAGNLPNLNGQQQRFDDAQQLCWTATADLGVACTVPQGATDYGYDTRGNRLTAVTPDNELRNHSYDQANRLSAVSDDTNPSAAPPSAMTGKPLVADFDGDDQDDVFFYRPGGSNDDWVWWGTDRPQFSAATGQFSVSGTFRTATGDYNCDGKGDILWYKEGSTTNNDYVWFWFGRYDTPTEDPYISKQFSIQADFTPFAGDFDADGCDDVFWYAPGSGVDAMWWGDEDVADTGTSFDLGGISVSGNYTPVVGNFNGAGADDIFWYGPGSTTDSLWTWATGTRTYSSTSYTIGATDYQPAAGDANGDGKDDLLWYSPAGTDNLWWGNAVASFGSGDQKALTLGSGITPAFGDFDGDAKSDLFVYYAAGSGDTMWWGAAKADFGTNASHIGFVAGPEMTASYTYGVDGLRTAKTVNGTTTTFTWSDGGGLPLLLAQKQGTQRTYVIYGPNGQPVQQINPDGSAVWLHHDQLGSVRLTTNAATGAEASRRTFTAYGAPIASLSTGTQPLLGYAGQYTDTETGYQYLRARHYDPTTGQFLSRDPLGGATEEPHGYVTGNPANGTDPTGLCGPFGNGGCPGGSLVPDSVSDAAGDVAEEAWEHRDKVATAAAIGVCMGATLGTCAVATASAFVVRSQVAVEKAGSWEAARKGVLVDGAITLATFGLVSVPSSMAFYGSQGRHWAASARGIFHGAPGWQVWASRGLVASPDLVSLFGSCFGRTNGE